MKKLWVIIGIFLITFGSLAVCRPLSCPFGTMGKKPEKEHFLFMLEGLSTAWGGGHHFHLQRMVLIYHQAGRFDSDRGPRQRDVFPCIQC